MHIYTASQARQNLYKLIDSVSLSHQPAYITGRRNKVVMLSEGDFQAMRETLYLPSIPGMRGSIEEGRRTPLQDCSLKLDW